MSLRSVRNTVAFGFGFGLMAAAGLASAAVDASVAAGLTSLEADATTLLGEVTPVVIFVLLGLLGIRLIRKIVSKAV